MHKFFFFLFFLFSFIVYHLSFVTPALAQGAKWSGACISSVDPTVPTIQGFECLFANILKVVVTVAGLAFVIMFIVGGFQYMRSGGDPKAATAASSTLTYAIIGLVGAIVSWLILLFIKDFTGIDVTQFTIPN